MTRRAARITHDEVCRMLRAARSAGLKVARYSFDGNKVDIIIADNDAEPVDKPDESNGLLREPQT